jgi:hypothetical protein
MYDTDFLGHLMPTYRRGKHQLLFPKAVLQYHHFPIYTIFARMDVLEETG